MSMLLMEKQHLLDFFLGGMQGSIDFPIPCVTECMLQGLLHAVDSVLRKEGAYAYSNF